MQTLATTFQNWKEEAARMCRSTKNDGITEGFHRKMKLIQGGAHGFRNFENDRLRLTVIPQNHNRIPQNPQKLSQTPPRSLT